MNRTLLGAAILLAASIGHAADYPQPIEALRGKGVEIIDQFDTGTVIKGYAAQYHGMALAVYLTPDEKHAIVGGTLVDASGEDMISKVLDEKVNLPQSEKLWQMLEQKSHWISEGNPQAATKVYVFTDANCPYCKRLWQDIQPWVKSGKAEIRHIPVGVLGESSWKKAAYILAAKDPLKALIANESGQQEAKEIEIAARQEQQLEDNLALMQSLGASGTPAIFFRDEKGLLQLYPGAAMGEQLIEIFGGRP